MADLSNELDDILNSFAEADRPAMRETLTRNPAAITALTSRETVYKAFVEGDSAKLATATAGAGAGAGYTTTPATTTPTTPPAAQSIGLGLDQINLLLNERDKRILASPEFTAAVESLAEKKAQAKFEAERANVIGRSAEISDTITSIRESHLREFNEPLDSAKFKEFYAAEGAKYGNDLTKSYDAYVQQRRIDKKIADGIAAGLAAQATSATPGTTVPTVGNPMAPNFVDFNVKKIDPNATVTPSANADAAAKAFATMRSGWTQ